MTQQEKTELKLKLLTIAKDINLERSGIDVLESAKLFYSWITEHEGQGTTIEVSKEGIKAI